MPTYSTVGETTYTVQPGETELYVECYGAQGGGGSGILGGRGGVAKGRLTVTPGEALTLRTGGKGGEGVGGYNGGGDGKGGGGGATDIRRGGVRLIVAAGGGGWSLTSFANDGADIAGQGGGLVGGDGFSSPDASSSYSAGKGATQSAGGAAGTNSSSTAPTAGSSGQGGSGARTVNGWTGGGGGGGLFGGGGGGGSTSEGIFELGASGGGGSSLVPAGGTTVTGERSGDGLIIIRRPPNAPLLNAPIGGVSLNRNQIQRFGWTPAYPEGGDSQSRWELRYRVVGAASWVTLGDSVPTQHYDLPGGSLAAGDYEWQVRTFGAQGLVGPWSSSQFFTMVTPSPGPTILSPANNTAVGTSVLLTWSIPTQTAYQVRTVADAAGNPDTSTVFTDTGTVNSTSAREHLVGFAVNARSEHIQVRTFDGLWSPWSSTRVTTSFTPPPAATVRVAYDNTLARLLVFPTIPNPTGSQPAVVSQDVRVRQVGSQGSIRVGRLLPPGDAFSWWAPASGVDYEIQVVTEGTNGATSESAWVSAALPFDSVGGYELGYDAGY